MGPVLAEIIAFLSKLPPEILIGLKSLVETLFLAKTDEDRRIAMDQALAAAEKAIIQKEFPG